MTSAHFSRKKVKTGLKAVGFISDGLSRLKSSPGAQLPTRQFEAMFPKAKRKAYQLSFASYRASSALTSTISGLHISQLKLPSDH